MTIAFTKSRLPFGWLGNMSAFSIEFAGKTWPTAEHLFQAMRFSEPAIREAIRLHKSPMTAKMEAKANARNMVIAPRSEADLANMRLVLKLKLEQYPDLARQLRETGSEEIVEDVSNRAHGNNLFWGAAKTSEGWRGENVLGKMWMQLRAAQ